MGRTIQSPGVQINEIDLSLRAVGAPPTTIFIGGYATKGPTSEPILIGSLSEFERIFGMPTNAAERYFYHTVKAVTRSPAEIMVYRLPYGEERGLDYSNTYSALVYPCSSYTLDNGITEGIAGTAIAQLSSSLTGNLSSTIDLTFGTGLSTLGISVNFDTVRKTVTSVNVLSGGLGYTNGQVITFTADEYSNDTNNSPLSVIITDTYYKGEFTSNFEINSGAYLFGQPTHVKLSEAQYLSILRGTAFTWSASSTKANGDIVTTFDSISSFAQAGLVILNKSQTTINSKFEGYYVSIIDNTNLNPATNYDNITKIASINSEQRILGGQQTGVNGYTYLPPARLNFALSATSEGISNSISQVMENLPSFSTDTKVDDNVVALGVFKLRQSVFSPDTIALDYVLEESYIASFDWWETIETNQGGPPDSFFLETVDDRSRNIISIVNPYISGKNNPRGWNDINGVPTKKVRFLSEALLTLNATSERTQSQYLNRFGAPLTDVIRAANVIGTTNSLYAVGDYVNQDLSTKLIGNVPNKVKDMLDKVENSEIYPLTITCEAGLGTIYFNSLNPATSGYFDDQIPYQTAVDALTSQNPDTIPQAAQVYMTVANEFWEFAEDRRKDHLFIADPLTNIFVEGQNIKTLDDPNKNFTQHIYWPLRNQFAGINSSYVCMFANIAKVADTGSNRQVWVPFSGFAAAAMAQTDSTYYPWFAPAGFTRGIVSGIVDLGFYPKQNQRDAIYKISQNPVVFFPNEGFVIFGQKTLLKRPSAFDRINVRRLFLYLETRTKNTARFFVFEPNTLFTRTSVKNILAPIFDLAKNTQGVYDYLIICDERNNTPDVIDDNSLVVDIYIKPVRAAEFILVNFYATRTGANFQEIIG